MNKVLFLAIEILIGILAVCLLGLLGWKIENYTNDIKNQSYNEGLNFGYENGLLYTQQTGNIVTVNENGEASEISVQDVCQQMIQNLNQQGGV